MKKLYFIALLFITTQKVFAQQNYCDFEGNKIIGFGINTGVLDTLSINPAPNSINSSNYCAKYIRDTAIYDNIKLYPFRKLEDVSIYADSTMQAPKMTMKLFSSAAIGTIINLQLGLKAVDNYPYGIHSEYWAVTTKQNEWELITFTYSQSPVGSIAPSTEVDKIVLLFHPVSTARDTMFFDDLSGPLLINTLGLKKQESWFPIKLFQNNPNPAKQITFVNFQLNSPGVVSLELFDMLGNSILSVLNHEMKTGMYSIPIETTEIPNGIYFYVLKKDGVSQTRRMVISKSY